MQREQEEAAAIADQRKKQQQDSKGKEAPGSSKSPVDITYALAEVRGAEQRKRDWSIISKLLVNIWPPGDYGTKARVVLGFGLLIAGKVRIANPSQLLAVTRRLELCRS